MTLYQNVQAYTSIIDDPLPGMFFAAFHWSEEDSRLLVQSNDTSQPLKER